MASIKIPQNIKIFLALMAVYFVWGSTFMALKIALQFMPPLLITGIRFSTGGIILFIITTLFSSKLPSWADIKYAMFMGLFLTGIGNATVAYALGYLPSGIVALFAGSIPIWILLIDYLFITKTNPTTSAIVGVLFALIGIVILFNPFDVNLSAVAFWPALLVCLGSISWAYGTLESNEFVQPTNRIQSAGMQMIFGGIVNLVASVATENPSLDNFKHLNAEFYLNLGYLIFVGTYIGYLSYLWLIRNANSILASTYAFVNPVVAVILGWLFLSEPITTQTIWAGIAIVFGLVLIILGNRRGRKSAKIKV